jgi:hypothetical protein
MHTPRDDEGGERATGPRRSTFTDLDRLLGDVEQEMLGAARAWATIATVAPRATHQEQLEVAIRRVETLLKAQRVVMEVKGAAWAACGRASERAVALRIRCAELFDLLCTSQAAAAASLGKLRGQ